MKTDFEKKTIKIEEGIAVFSQKKEDTKKEEEEDRRRFLSGLNLATELGFLIAVPIAGGALLGSYIDQKLGTIPRCTLSFLFLGIMVASYSVYKIIKEL